MELPERRWSSLATDFIVSLPTSKGGFDAITVWFDRLTKRVHFLSCTTNDSAEDTANAFFANIFIKDGMQDSITSDRDPKFISKFWDHPMELRGVKLKMSTSRHTRTDGETAIMKRMVKNYLRSYLSSHQNDCDKLLSAAEFAYKSAVTEDPGMSPFEMDLGQTPKYPLDMHSGKEIPVRNVEEFKEKLKESLQNAHYSYRLAKAIQSAYSSLKYLVPNYKVEDRVWLNMSLFEDAYEKSQDSDKLRARRFGPFVIIQLIGKILLRLSSLIISKFILLYMLAIQYHKSNKQLK